METFGQNAPSAHQPGPIALSRPRTPAREKIAPQGSGAGRVRIIGGEWRSRRIAVADSPGLRPTPDRIRETVFNWLGQRLDGYRCLDLFAGSGVLGLEALSRGAVSATLVERSRDVAANLARNATALGATGAEIVIADALEFLAQTGRQGAYDLAFIDPPFSAGLHEPVLKLLPAVLAPGGRAYLESSEQGVPPGWVAEKEGRAGKVHFYLIRREPA